MKIIYLFLIVGYTYFVDADKACIPKIFEDTSIVCVCNSTYCDEVDPLKTLPAGQFVQFQSTAGGLRFSKKYGYMNHTYKNIVNNDLLSLIEYINNGHLGNTVLSIRRKTRFQKIHGFGGSITDSVGINLKKLSPGARENLYKSYFSDTGLRYNMLRMPMGSSDFATRHYTYNMKPENDIHLTNFSLAPEDIEYKIATIENLTKIATDEVHLIASSWAPPEWMTKIVMGRMNLAKKYYQLYADYHIRYLQELKKLGVKVWAITTGNDAFSSQTGVLLYALAWKFPEQLTWIEKNLGPTLRKSEFSNVLLFGIDDDRLYLPVANVELAKRRKAVKYLDGFALHFYLGEQVPIALVDDMHQLFPDKMIIQNEASIAIYNWETYGEIIQLGSWSRGEKYFFDILRNLNHWYSAWIDWNLCLDFNGGPNWQKNQKDASIILSDDSDEFFKQPMFYAIGHFSKFIPRGSIRVLVENNVGDIENVAFLRPDGGITVVLYNPYQNRRNVQIQESGRGALQIQVLARSFVTVVYW